MKILTIEDDIDTTSMYRIVLQQMGDVVSTSLGREGVAIVAVKKPDVVILDLGLPDQSGLETLREIRKIDYNVPVLVVTAHTNTDEMVEALNAGASDFVVKPFQIRELKARINARVRYAQHISAKKDIIKILEIQNG